MASVLPRLHLFELSDLAATPAPLRHATIDALGRMLDWGGLLDGLVVPLERFLTESGATEIVELGAGSGEDARVLTEAFARARRPLPAFRLTDIHPRIERWSRLQELHPSIEFEMEPVDATQIPIPVTRGRACLFLNVLHHFRAEDVGAALDQAAEESRGFLVAEIFRRNPLEFANLLPIGGVALAAGPLLDRQERLMKALLTWISPVATLASIWDGVVSALRVWEPEDLTVMTAHLTGWRFTTGSWRYPPLGRGFYFYGVPPD